jgi:6,7-dimethyl-8-ribityllumazine synthase
MPRIVEGKLVAKGLKFAVLVSRFNSFVTERLLEGAMDGLLRHEASDEDVVVYRVPGAFEMPLVAQRTAASGKFDAVIALAAVIRGSTPHFDYVAAETSKGLAAASLQTGVPIAYGVLTTDTVEQAIDRAGAKAGNKGWQAAVSAIEMANLLKAMQEQ